MQRMAQGDKPIRDRMRSLLVSRRLSLYCSNDEGMEFPVTALRRKAQG